MFEVKQSPTCEFSHVLAGVSDEEDPLDGSIDKWRTLVRFLIEHPDVEVEDGGRLTCPLCELYWHYGCMGCIVGEHSEDSQCRGTPYDEWGKYGDLQSAEGMLEFLIGLKEDG